MLMFKNTKNEPTGCCTSQPKGKVACPLCHTLSKGVLGKTVEHLLTDEAKEALRCFDGFYFCKTPSCEAIYFREELIIRQKEMSVVVGHKEGAKPATVCYCFDWRKEKIQVEIESRGKSSALEDIKEKMNTLGCSYEILNPSAGYCLGDVGKVIKNLLK